MATMKHPELNSPNAPHRVAKLAEVTEREARVFNLRKAGLHLTDIAREVGVSIGTVHATLETGRQKYAMLNMPLIEQERIQEAERLDYIQAALWPALDAEETGDRVAAANALVRLSARRCAMLGLDAPTRAVVETADPAAEAEARARKRAMAADPEACRLLQELAARQAALAPQVTATVQARAHRVIERLDTETLVKLHAATQAVEAESEAGTDLD